MRERRKFEAQVAQGNGSERPKSHDQACQDAAALYQNVPGIRQIIGWMVGGHLPCQTQECSIQEQDASQTCWREAVSSTRRRCHQGESQIVLQKPWTLTGFKGGINCSYRLQLGRLAVRAIYLCFLYSQLGMRHLQRTPSPQRHLQE